MSDSITITNPTENPATTATPPSTGEKQPVTFSAEQQNHINELIGRARKEGKTAAETTASDKAESDRVAKEQADALKAGDFEKVKKTIESERDTEKVRAERLLKIATADLEARTKALNDLGDKELSDAFAAITDPLEQLEYLNDPRTKRAMATVKEEKDVEDAQKRLRIPGTPRPNAEANGADAELQRARQSGKYAPI